MIVIIAEHTLPEPARARVLPALHTLDQETQREAGCLFFRHALDVSRPDTVVLTEVWQDAATLLGHFRMPHFTAFRQLARELGVRTRLRQFRAHETAREDAEHTRSLLLALDAEAKG
jgi:quinol monooxygenase YgiN